MKMPYNFPKRPDEVARPFPVSAALLLIVAGVNITATVLSLLAAI